MQEQEFTVTWEDSKNKSSLYHEKESTNERNQTILIPELWHSVFHCPDFSDLLIPCWGTQFCHRVSDVFSIVLKVKSIILHLLFDEVKVQHLTNLVLQALVLWQQNV